MPATTPDGLRYPLPGDNPNIPRDLGYLAADTQAALTRLDGRGQVHTAQRGTDATVPGAGGAWGVVLPAQAGQVWVAHLTLVLNPTSGAAYLRARAADLRGCQVVGYDGVGDWWDDTRPRGLLWPLILSVTGEDPYFGVVVEPDVGGFTVHSTTRIQAFRVK